MRIVGSDGPYPMLHVDTVCSQKSACPNAWKALNYYLLSFVSIVIPTSQGMFNIEYSMFSAQPI